MTTAKDARAMQRHLVRLQKEAEEEQEPSPSLTHSRVSVGVGVTGDPDVTEMDWTNDRPHDESIFLPSECPTGLRSCCLESFGQVCGGPTRGRCVNITETGTVCRASSGLFWFADYFDNTCVCEGNRWGPACESCATGWRGENCTERAPFLVRRNFASLSATDKQYVINAFRLAKITPSQFQPAVSVFDFWALIHHWSLPAGVMDDTIARDNLDPAVAEGHGGAGAIPYHRSLVAGIERGLQYALGNDSFAIPYWNWTGSAGNDNDITLKWFGGDGDADELPTLKGDMSFCRQIGLPGSGTDSACNCVLNRGPFAKWPLIGDWGYPLNQTVERAFGCRTLTAPTTPVQTAADCSVRIDKYDSYHDRPNPVALPANATDDTTPPRVEPEADKEVSTSLRRAAAKLRVRSDGTTVMFHNLLGGGVLCDDLKLATWPRGQTDCDMHKRIHQWLAGTMIGHHPASDPLFWMLHSYADVVFEQWIRTATTKHRFSTFNSWSPISGPLGNTLEECQGPFYPLQTNRAIYKDSRDLGFTYDLFQDNPETPNFYGAYYDAPWHYAFPHMDEIQLLETVEHFSTSASGEIPQDTSFFVPSECGVAPESQFVSDIALTSSCCPMYAGEVCGGVTRGRCSNMTDSNLFADLQSTPDQLWWLTNSFTAACMCLGHYDGVNCGVCKPGYEGATCSTVSEKRIRRDFKSLATTDMQYIVDAFRTARIAQSAYQPGVSVLTYFASMVFWHLPGNSFLRATDDVARGHYAWHGQVLWRRELLMRLEQELGRITGNSSFVLPYWNVPLAYSTDQEPVNRWFGGDGNTNVSVIDGVEPSACRQSTYDGYGGCNCSITRDPFNRPALFGLFGKEIGTVQRTFACLGNVAASLPTPDVFEYTAQIETFYARGASKECFSKTLTGMTYDEGVHTWPHGEHGDVMARIQNWVGGTMTVPGIDQYRATRSSPGSDPLYYLILSYGDLILERWLRRAETNGWPTVASLPKHGAELGLNRDEVMAPFFPLKTNAQAFVNSIDTGYSYDFFDQHPNDHLFE